MSFPYKFGLKKSKIEEHDRIVSVSCECLNIDFPIKFSLKDKVKHVYDQLSLSSCSANAAVNALKMSDDKKLIKCDNISRLYLYFCTRWIDNNYILPIHDQGATLKSVFKALEQYNYIDEIKYPYIVENVNNIPSQEIFEEALKINKCPIVSYKQILQSKSSFKCALYKMQRPILCGIMLYSNFYKLTKDDDVLELPSKDDELLGGHAIVVCGYDEETKTFEILNSHGSDFANDGYFRIKYEYLLNHDLAFEFYIINS